MTFFRYASLLIAGTGFFAAQPCAAATDATALDERRVSAFAGINMRMPLGGAKPVRPTARLQLTSSYNVRDARTGSMRAFKVQGLELGATGKGGATLYMNGQSTAQMQEKLQLSGSTGTTVTIIFGVVLVGVAILVLSGLDDLGESVPPFVN